MRYIDNYVQDDLNNKMVFIGGPRQVGKTTYALSLLGIDPLTQKNHPPGYINWDLLDDKNDLRNGRIPDESLIVLDEIHKYRGWRNLAKGLFDKYRMSKKFVITGSARLDYYSKGGDSLQGRYHYYRMHPFSLKELDPEFHSDSVHDLLNLGGFPEPLFSGSKRTLRRWQRNRIQRVLTEDIRDMERVNEISSLQLLAEMLPKRVGSPLSVNSVREDLGVAHDTVKRWLKIFENMYVGFAVPPFGSDRFRAIKKEQKYYLWDWTLCPDEGARFENMVACQLLKYCHLEEDWQGYNMELRYIRERGGKEVDFVVIRDGEPLFAVECKLGKTQLDTNISYFKERLDTIPRFYQVHLKEKDVIVEKNIRICPFSKLCKEQSLP